MHKDKQMTSKIAGLQVTVFTAVSKCLVIQLWLQVRKLVVDTEQFHACAKLGEKYYCELSVNHRYEHLVYIVKRDKKCRTMTVKHGFTTISTTDKPNRDKLTAIHHNVLLCQLSRREQTEGAPWKYTSDRAIGGGFTVIWSFLTPAACSIVTTGGSPRLA